jgi:hypothetical protein
VVVDGELVEIIVTNPPPTAKSSERQSTDVISDAWPLKLTQLPNRGLTSMVRKIRVEASACRDPAIRAKGVAAVSRIAADVDRTEGGRVTAEAADASRADGVAHLLRHQEPRVTSSREIERVKRVLRDVEGALKRLLRHDEETSAAERSC